MAKKPPPRFILIGPGVSIGAKAVILPGVKIRKNARIAAGAIITKNVRVGELSYGANRKG